MDTRKKNLNWRIDTNDDGTTPHHDVQFALLMDIRDELQMLNGLLRCQNFQRIPFVLDSINRNTTKKRKRRK